MARRAPELRRDTYECEEEVVDGHGDVATVIHPDQIRATVLGEDRSGTFVIPDLWLRESD